MQRPAAMRVLVHWLGGESECQSFKGSRGSEPWRSAYLRNEAKFVVARGVGGTATFGGASTAPLNRLCGKDRHTANPMSCHASRS